ncbi:MAG: serine/threonine-protein kinase [Planctomycetaceae bacterium]
MTTGTPSASDPSSTGTAFAFLRPLPTVRPEASDSDETRPAPPARDRWDRLFPSSLAVQDAGSSLNVAGLQLGPYQILDRIGRGGMGAVFRANDLRLDRVVALKILAPEYTRDPACVQRFQNEARAAAKLDHQNIARIFASGEDSGQQYIAFEYVSGTNVRDMIQQRGTLTPAETVNYILQIAESLRHTSAMGVVHRDIKPSNIIVTPTGRAKLVDLGLARHRTEGSDDLTVHGTTLGTFDYISPEQALDPRNVDVRSDIYSLGCTAFHMLTGEPPYNRGSMFQKVLDHHKVDAPDASARNPHVPQALSHIVRKMMASQVEDRYQRPEDLIRDLLPLANAMGVPTRTGLWSDVPAPRFSWLEHRGWVLALSLLAVIGIAAGLPPQEANPVSEPANPRSLGSIPTEKETPVGASTVTATDTPPEVPPSPPTSSATSSPPGKSSSATEKPIGGLLSGARFNGLNPRPRTGQIESSPAMANVSPSRSSSTSDSTPIPPDLVTEPPFWVIATGADGTNQAAKSYPSLEAACLDAPDNSTIELRFDGNSKPQIPIRIERKSLRIRAMEGRRPVLVFDITGPLGPPVTSQMISVINSELEISDLDIVFRVPARRAVDRWSIFSLGDAKKLTLDGVSVTLENVSGQQLATLFEIKPPTGNRIDRLMPDGMQRGPLQVSITDSLFRGEADGFRLDEAHNSRIDMTNSAWAISGTMLSIDTVNSQLATMSVEPPPCQVTLDHVTAVMDGSLISVVCGKAGIIPTVDVRCDNSLISLLRPDKSMIAMSGSLDLEDWTDRLIWKGTSNYVDVQGPWWDIACSPSRKYNAADWGQHWSSSSNTPIDKNVFESIGIWDKPVFHAVTPRSFYLFSGGNKAYKAPEADDGTRAGVNWNRTHLPSKLPQLSGTTSK